MNVEPDKKKARSAKDTPSDMPVGGIHFTPELIARVATFAEAVVQPGHERAFDVKNICLAVGPIPSRTIKHYYLKNNLGYLEKVMKIFAHLSNAEWARECHLAWMSVNTGWRGLVTDELMERYRRAILLGDRGFRLHSLARNIHPLLALVNPAVAIEMGLLEALKYLVEVKGIDINAKRWLGLDHRLIQRTHSLHYHLIVTPITVDNYDAFQYLMSADAIDIYSISRDSPADDPPIRSSIFSYAIFSYKKKKNGKRFFEAFVDHAKFQANGRFFAGYEAENGEDTG